MSTPKTLSPIMDVDGVAEYLGYSRKHVLRLLNLGKIPGVRHGKRWFIREEDLGRWLDPTTALEVAS